LSVVRQSIFRRYRRAAFGEILAQATSASRYVSVFRRLVTDRRNHPAEERRIREAALNETVTGSFPVSDPASSLPNPDEHDAEGNA
jgi:hypothetical protein